MTFETDSKAGEILNLEKQVEDDPELFVQAVAFIYRRSDGGEDPERLRATDPEEKDRRAEGAQQLLDKLSHIPGQNAGGELDPERLLNWVRHVRNGCTKLARTEKCDFQIGKLFSKAPIGNDDAWPCEPVRDVIEQIATEHLAEGIRIGLINSRGVHWRGEGGEQERQLAGKYAAWADALQFTHPRAARILRDMERWYQQDANREDNDTKIQKRLER